MSSSKPLYYQGVQVGARRPVSVATAVTGSRGDVAILAVQFVTLQHCVSSGTADSSSAIHRWVEENQRDLRVPSGQRRSGFLGGIG